MYLVNHAIKSGKSNQGIKINRTSEEMAAENQAQQNEEFNKKKIKIEDEDEDKPIYNPKNVPLGWDGK
jgi:single-stranded DNA-specific DHH superfamily exonuclease